MKNQSILRAPTMSPLRHEAAVSANDAMKYLSLVCAIALSLTYFLRGTLLTYVGSLNMSLLLEQMSVAALIVSFGFLCLVGFKQLNVLGFAVLLATALSLWHCERAGYVFSRWLGWVMLVALAGPVVSGPYVALFRRSALGLLKNFCMLVTVLSAFWWGMGLPNMGRGDFTGVMWHSMLLAPLAALAGLFSLSRACSGGAARWYLLYSVSLMVTLLASSRSALLGLLLGSLVVLVLKAKRSPFLSIMALLFAFQVALFPMATLDLAAAVTPGDLVSGLERKELNHSREKHWEARWDEFASSPLFGIGFMSAWEGSVGYDDETGGVETGSSYIALLSMTGIVGLGTFLLLVISAVVHVYKKWHLFDEYQKMQICAVGSFWVVHLGAEGYILAVGSLPGLIFWMWMGNLDDTLRSQRKVETRMHAKARPTGVIMRDSLIKDVA